MRDAPTVGSLFSGIGGIDLGLERAGFRTAWFCEADPYCRAVLAKHWPGVPCFPDVRTLGCDVPRVDLLAGGFPCQPVSLAGKRLVQADERWLWPAFARLIGLLRPRFVLLENVPGLTSAGLLDVLRDLIDLGFDAEWSIVSACSMGAAHMRRRLFLVAYPNREQRWQGIWNQLDGPAAVFASDSDAGSESRCEARMEVLSDLYRTPDGLSDQLDRNRVLGNAVVPQVAQWIGEHLRPCFP